MQCSNCSEWVHLRFSLFCSSKLNTLGSSHLWSCHPCSVFASPGGFQHYDFYFWGVTQHVCPHSLICPIWSPFANPAPSHYPRLQTSYFRQLGSSSICTFPPSYVSSCSSTSPAPSSTPDSLSVLQWHAGGLRARNAEFLHFTSLHLVDLICFQESNLASCSSVWIHGTLFCNLIALTSGLAFFLQMTCIPAVTLSYSSGRAYSSLKFLLPLSFCLIPTLTM